jgi:6-phosphogluconolactonase (cycloisomerase 2 family)
MTPPLWKALGATLAALTLLGGLTACGGGGGDTSNDGSTTPTAADTSPEPLPVSTAVPRFAYVVNGASNTVSIYRVDASTGQWRPNGYALTGDRPSSVTVDPSGQFAYVANYYGNSITTYTVNASNGALTKVGDDVPTGETPHAITIDAQHRFAYVSHDGEGGALSTYAIDPTSGALSKAGDDVPTGEGPLSLVIAPSGQFAFLATRGAQTLLAFAVDAQTGALTQIGNASYLESPNAIRMDPGGKFLYALGDGGVLTTLGIDARTGRPGQVGDAAVIPGNEAVAMTIAPSGTSGYVVNKSSNTVSAFAVNRATGAVTHIGDVDTGKLPVAVTIDVAGQFAYVANGGDQTVSAYRIHTSTGALTPVSQVRAQMEPSAIAVVSGPAAASVTPQVIYAPHGSRNAITSYRINAQDGSLTPMSEVATDTKPRRIALDPYGRWAYVAHERNRVISVYSIDSDGVLHPLSDVSEPGSGNPRTWGPNSLVVDPSGRFVYAHYASTNEIQAFAMDASTGALTSVGQFTTTSWPTQLHMDPVGLFIYASSSSDNRIAIWRINAHTGGLTALDDSVTSTGRFATLAIDPYGQRVHMVASGPQLSFYAYNIDASTGQLVDAHPSLTPPPPANDEPPPADQVTLNPGAFLIDPTGKFAYVAVHSSDLNHNVLSTYSIGDNGLLSKVADVPFGTAENWQGAFAIDPSGRFVYAFDTITVSTFSIDAGLGTLTPEGKLPSQGAEQWTLVEEMVVMGVVR